MKICTDSLLFGAMVPIRAGDSVLDIGTGSGVLALMAAQKGARRITAVEICGKTCEEADDNFNRSPWASRLQALNQDIQTFAQVAAGGYDLIISNPPFFEQHLKSIDAAKRQVRHTDSLSFAELIAAAAKLLAAHGLFYVLLPVHAVSQFVSLAAVAGLRLKRRTDFRGFADKPAKVSALTFSRIAGNPETAMLTVYASEGVYTQESAGYLQPFLLRFAKVE